ncbi:MAG: AarF/ABC1/UbiB kinase family protein [Deltaproteobacteria bacterium]|nr:AarF/ABC1/UbiB kinase family protein [Deltaproteobacteria bacterium]
MKTLLNAVRLYLQVTVFLFQFLFYRVAGWFVGGPTREKRIEWRNRKIYRSLRMLLQRMGATFIKLGQILSSRPDLLPPDLVGELKHLQDRVPPFPFRKVEEAVRRNFGRPIADIYADFDNVPVAAASVAQVHHAHLKSGEEVAVKVLRPNIREQVDRDLAIAGFFAWILDRLPVITLAQAGKQVAEFGAAIRAQTDLRVEAENNRRFQKNFAGVQWMKIPKLYAEFCSEEVLTMEFVRGARIEEVTAPGKLALSPTEMAKRLFEVYIKMAFEDLFIHSDMHPGNLWFQPDGGVVMIDLGLITQIKPTYLLSHYKVNFALWGLSAEKMAAALDEAYGFPGTPEEFRAFTRDIDGVLDMMRGRKHSEIEFGEMMMRTFQLAFKYRMPFDSDATMISVAYATFEGMSKMFDPHFDVFAFLISQAPRFKKKADEFGIKVDLVFG